MTIFIKNGKVVDIENKKLFSLVERFPSSFVKYVFEEDVDEPIIDDSFDCD